MANRVPQRRSRTAGWSRNQVAGQQRWHEVGAAEGDQLNFESLFSKNPLPGDNIRCVNRLCPTSRSMSWREYRPEGEAEQGC
jgi:hypothetical protein